MTAAIDHALIMAAGRGVRMLPLTETMPKAMAPFAGTTLIAQGIDKIRPHVRDVHVTVGHHGAMLAEHVIQHGASTVINTHGHGNSWWLYNSFLSLLGSPLLVLTCDNVVELDFELLQHEYERIGEPACMIVPVRPVDGVDGDYIVHDDADVVTGITRDTVTDLYCSGIQVINPHRTVALTEATEEFTAVWKQLLPLREVRMSRIYPQSWYSVDTLAQLATVPVPPG